MKRNDIADLIRPAVVGCGAFALVVVIVLVVGAWFVFGGPTKCIDTGFATKALVSYHYNGRHNDRAVTNASDLRALKDLLRGRAYGGEVPACMFTTDVSVTLTGRGKSMTFCPGFCADGQVRVDQSEYFLRLSDKDADSFYRVCRKYGLDITRL